MAFSSSCGALADALFQQFLMLPDFFLGGGQRLDHPVEAFAQIFDFVAGAADLDGLEPPLPDRRDTGLQAAPEGGPAGAW